MSAYVPDSTIKIYSIPELNTNEGQTFVSINPNSNVVASNVKCQVIKKNQQVLRVSTPLATIQNCNYISFINPSYGNKLYWGRIRSIDYINNKTTQISYTIDWWLTDKDNITFSPCEILREGLTKREHTRLSVNPYEDFIKMRTGESLDFSQDSEPYRYAICSDIYTNNKATAAWDGWNVMLTSGHVLHPNIENHYYDNELFYVLSYVGSEHNLGDTTTNIAMEVTKRIREYTNDTSGAYLLTAPRTWGNPSDASNMQMPYYAEARHKSTANISYSTVPVDDIKIGRPYYMCGCDDMEVIANIIDDCFTYTDSVSSIISIYAFPTYILDEFITCGFDHPASELDGDYKYVKIPFPNVIAETQPGMEKFDKNWSPKLFRFPYTYASLDSVNGSGHIELHLERMGAFDPSVDSQTSITPGSVRTDPQTGEPTYFVLEKFVSITADGVYMGAGPVDYKDRIVTSANGQIVHETGADLDNAVFYVEFPQVPFTTDAFYEFLGHQAKSALINETALTQAQRAADFDRLAREGTTLAIGAAQDIVGGLIGVGTAGIGGKEATGPDYGSGVNSGLGVIGSAVNYVANEANRQQSMDLIRQQANLAIGANSYMSNPQEPNDFTSNYANAKAAFVTDNYHSGSCGGVLNMMKFVQPIGVYITIRRRTPDFYRAYNNFFKNYGYATKEFDFPKIKYLLDNDSSNDNAPYFESRGVGSGAGAHVDFVFYTKTEGLRVSGVCEESANFIENMFNNGVLFVSNHRP